MVLHTAQTTEWCTWWWCHTDTLEHLEKEVGFGVLDDVHSESIADIIALVSTFSLCRLLWSIQFSSVSFSNSVLKISFPCNLTLASRCSFPLFLSYSVLPLPFSLLQLSSVQSLSRVRLFVTPWTAACQASLSITNSRSLLKLMSIASVMPSNHLFLCGPLLLPSAIFPSIRVFTHESVLHIRWPKYWSFCFSISPSSEFSGQISFRMDWLDLLAVQGTHKSLLWHHSSKASILRHPAFFIVQLTSIHDYWKNHSSD